MCSKRPCRVEAKVGSKQALEVAIRLHRCSCRCKPEYEVTQLTHEDLLHLDGSLSRVYPGAARLAVEIQKVQIQCVRRSSHIVYEFPQALTHLHASAESCHCCEAGVLVPEACFSQRDLD